MLMIPAEIAGKERHFLEELYQTHQTLLYIIAKKYVGENDCEDVVQDAVVRMAQNVSTLRRLEPKALMTYLNLTVRSAALNHLEHQRVVRLHSSDLTVDEAHQMIGPERLSDGLEVILLRREMTDALLRAIKRLPERDQILLQGKYYLGLSSRELETIVGCKASSIRMLLTRAKRALIAELEKEGIIDG